MPDQVEAPVTSIVSDTVQIDWTIPYDGSSPILSYIITIRHFDGVVYTEELANCNGQDIAIVSEHKCNVLISDLIQLPYHHYWGDSIWARVIATNIIGNSIISDEGNGAIILRAPDAPTDLSNLPAITAAT